MNTTRGDQTDNVVCLSTQETHQWKKTTAINILEIKQTTWMNIVKKHDTKRHNNEKTRENTRRGWKAFNREVEINSVNHTWWIKHVHCTHEKKKLGENMFTLLILHINYCILYIINGKRVKLFLFKIQNKPYLMIIIYHHHSFIFEVWRIKGVSKKSIAYTISIQILKMAAVNLKDRLFRIISFWQNPSHFF